MEIVLIRHGEPEWVRDGLNVHNPPLTERGRRQARSMAEHLRDEHFDEVHCSPLVRARQTAEPLFGVLGRPESIEPWLEEIRNDPLWHGTPQERADEAYRQERARASQDRWDGIEGGEPPREFVARIHFGNEQFLAGRGMQPIAAGLPMWQISEPDRRIALVAHAGTNSVIICAMLGITPTPWEWDRFMIGHGSICRLQSMEMGDGHSFALKRLGDDEYLASADRTR